MKKTMTTSEIADELRADEYGGWSYAGAHAMAEHLEQLEEDTGQEIEFDRVAIRCDFSEYPSALDAAKEYGFEPDAEEDEEEQEESAADWLRERTTLVEFTGGAIVQGF